VVVDQFDVDRSLHGNAGITRRLSRIRGQQVDARTDEYALACVAFALLSGKPPFHRNGAMAVMYAQLSVPPPMLDITAAGPSTRSG